jgi:uncharacterized membrane protein YphA (DoxX/SURF4 family)
MDSSSRAKIWKWVLLVCRVALGVIFLVAAVSKMRPLEGLPWTVASVKTSLAMFAMGIDSYQILPQWAVTPVAQYLPLFEIFLGLWLISGIALRISSIFSTLALCAFMAAMGSVWHRGLTVTCGCFGQGGPPIGPKDMMRDGFLFLPLSVILLVGSFLLAKKSRARSAGAGAAVPQTGS